MDQTEKSDFSILVVDDNKVNLELVSMFLKKQGYQIALSLNTDDAMAILREHPIDLILLDIMMPGTDGLTFCRQLKTMPEFLNIPVIFLTAKTDTDDLVEGFNAGGVDYVTKPFRKAELNARIENLVKLALAKKRIIRQAEEIKKITRTKDRLYSVIAHDIKSPFSNIAMLISTLAEGYLEPCSEEFETILSDINTSSQETYALLEKLLQWTRSQTGDLQQVNEPLNLQKIITNVCRFCQPQAVKKRIEISCACPDDLIIEADRNMIRSILQNLVSNAVKFTPEGGSVTVEGARSGACALIRVKDSGIGIPEENIKLLMAGQGEVSTRGTNDEKGTGLGFMLVKDFVDRNGGTIEVESKVGHGSTFTIKFSL